MSIAVVDLHFGAVPVSGKRGQPVAQLDEPIGLVLPGLHLDDGDEVEAKFMGVDRKSRAIMLSIKAKEMQDEQEAISSYKSDQGAAPVGTTLGELLKEKMSGGSN